jgi:dTDP-4-amino-4,6-dideoxygalactose transaminase
MNVAEPKAPPPEGSTPTVPFVRPYFEVDDDLLMSIRMILESGKVTNNGVFVRKFEAAVAEYLGVPDAVTVSSGAAGLFISLRAMGLTRRKVVLPAYTFIATLSAALDNGLQPVWCDIDPETFTMSPQHLRRIVENESDIGCVIPVNVFGIPPPLEIIGSIAEWCGAAVLYDDAHGFGTETDGRRFSPHADAEVFSFHATKVMPAVEGGAIIAKDHSLLWKSRQLRNHGLARHLLDSLPGTNGKLDEVRAAVGARNLQTFPSALARRRQYGGWLRGRVLRHSEVFLTQRVPEAVRTNYQNFALRCKVTSEAGPDTMIAAFAREGVEVRSYFNPPLNRLTCWPWVKELPNTEAVWRSTVCLPLHSRMSELELGTVDQALSAVSRQLV